MDSSPRSIKSSLEQTLRSLGLSPKLEQYNVLELWPAIVGERIARVTTAEHVNDGKLVVHVTRATWRNELIFLKKEIIDKINAAIGHEVVKDIIFR